MMKLRITKAKQKKLDRIAANKAMKEWTRMVKERDGYVCQMCRTAYLLKPRGLNAAHIIPRTVKETALDLMNGISLCASCHEFGNWSFHKNPIYFSNWLRRYKIDQYMYLLQKMADIKNMKDKTASIKIDK